MLTFSIDREVWGQAEWSPSATLCQQVRRRCHNACHICGWQAASLPLHLRDGNPENLREDNLCLICPVCETWQHLNRLNGENAVMVYLPEVEATDISHLMRTTLMALRSDSPVLRARGERVLNWMTAHRKECEALWGSSNPAEFALAMLQMPPAQWPSMQAAFRHLAVIVHPGYLNTSIAPVTPAEWQSLLTTYPLN
jgi:intracellular multiplication protein IcmJ